MGGWRRRVRCVDKITVTVVVTAVVVVVTLLATAGGDGGGDSGDGGNTITLTTHPWSPHASPYPHHTPYDATGPRVLLVGGRKGGGGGFLERLLGGVGEGEGVLEGGLVILDKTQPPSPDINCITTRVSPVYPLCPHPPHHDRHITNKLLQEGTWQSNTLALLIKALRHFPHPSPLSLEMKMADCRRRAASAYVQMSRGPQQHQENTVYKLSLRSSTVVDGGGHVGVFSLAVVGAGAGAVVAVEPVWASAVKLHAGAAMGGVADKVTIVHHALTHRRGHAKLKYKPGNLGGTSVIEVTPAEADVLRASRPLDLVTSVTLDDLAPLINTSVILVKLDVEGWECRVVMGGKRLLTSHYVPYIFMEWAVMANNRHKYHAPCRPHHLTDMVRWLVGKGYQPHITKSGVQLNPAKVDDWRASDIYWRHQAAPHLH